MIQKFLIWEGFVEAMRPVAEITEVMGKEKQVSFSAVQLFLYKLLSVHVIEKPSDFKYHQAN